MPLTDSRIRTYRALRREGLPAHAAHYAISEPRYAAPRLS